MKQGRSILTQKIISPALLLGHLLVVLKKCSCQQMKKGEQKTRLGGTIPFCAVASAHYAIIGAYLKT